MFRGLVIHRSRWVQIPLDTFYLDFLKAFVAEGSTVSDGMLPCSEGGGKTRVVSFTLPPDLICFLPERDDIVDMVSFPFPIIGVMIPLFNFGPATPNYKALNEGQMRVAHTLVWYREDLYKNLPYVFVCINYPDAAPFADFGDPHWWLPTPVSGIALARVHRLAGFPITVIEREIGERDTIPQAVLRALSL